MADTVIPDISGIDLFDEIEPIIDDALIDGATFISRMAATISEYVTSTDTLTGTYLGYIPGSPPVPSTLIVAHGAFIPNSIAFEPPENYELNYYGWIKDSLLNKLNWKIVATPPHIYTAPTPMVPIVSLIDLLGDLSEIRTAKGVWALICDAIVWALLSSVDRITPVNATATDGSNGVITWIPLEIPDFVHDFIFEIHYDATNTQLAQWLQDHDIDTSHLVGDVDVPLNGQPYQMALGVWLGLKAITKDCKFYKKQSEDKKILLTTGSAI